MIDYNETGASSERVSDEYLQLNSCGIEYLSERDRGSMRKNGRMDYHILYIERGVCHLDLDREKIEVGAGGIIFYRPFEPQIYSFYAKDESISHYVHFTGSGVEGLLERLGIGELKLFDMGESHRYKEIMADMVREYTMRKPCYETFCAARLLELLGLIGRKYTLRNNRVGRAGESRINAACRRIYDDLASPPDVTLLAREACLSVSRFTHLFREVTGKSYGDFVRTLRVNRAKELLSHGELTVGEVARMVGYDDQNYFSRIFRDNVGCSPMKYAKDSER